MRAVLEAAGIKNVLSKSLGSNNQLSVVTATLNGLSQLRTADQISDIRGEEVSGPAFTRISKEIQAIVPESAEAVPESAEVNS